MKPLIPNQHCEAEFQNRASPVPAVAALPPEPLFCALFLVASAMRTR
jgi:hypothetical protein